MKFIQLSPFLNVRRKLIPQMRSLNCKWDKIDYYRIFAWDCVHCSLKRNRRGSNTLEIQSGPFPFIHLKRRIKPGFYTIAAIPEGKKKFSDGSDHSYDMEHDRWDNFFLSQWSLSLRSLRSLECGFHMIGPVVAIAELFLSQRSKRSQRS